jgi:chromosome partitioning protein
MGTVLAFLNFKGGVGKTANVVNIAGCLAATHDKRVLVVDLDAQCNASLWLLGKYGYREHTLNGVRTIGQALLDRLEGTNTFNFIEAVAHGVPRTARGFYEIQNLDVLPATIDLLPIEDRMMQRGDPGSYGTIRELLAPHLSDYDYIFLDCAPNFFTLTKNAVLAADHLVIPYIPDFLSLTGFQTLAKLVTDLHANARGAQTAAGARKIAAVIVNRYVQVGNVYRQGLLELEVLINDLRQKHLIHPGAKVLEPAIRNCVKVMEAPAEHRPIVLHAPQSIGGTDYAALAQSLARHLEEIT